jgi:hypothetical protein
MIIPIATAAYQLAQAGYNFYKQGKDIKAAKSAERKVRSAEDKMKAGLSRDAREGRVDVMGQTAGFKQDAYGGARAASQQVRGNLMRRGMEGSIAGVAATANPYLQASQQVARESSRLRGENDRTKQQAAGELRQFDYQTGVRRSGADAAIKGAQGERAAGLGMGIASAGLGLATDLWGKGGALAKKDPYEDQNHMLDSQHIFSYPKIYHYMKESLIQNPDNLRYSIS